MNTDKLYSYIRETYGALPEYPWANDSETAVFRHKDNKKWFALVMNIPKSRLGLTQQDSIWVMNLKCEYVLISSLLSEAGFFPAYHMNKTHWITVALDGSVDEDRIKWLVAVSHDLTKAKGKKRTQGKK